MKKAGIGFVLYGAAFLFLAASGEVFKNPVAVIVVVASMVLIGSLLIGINRIAFAMVATSLVAAVIFSLFGCAAPHTRLKEMPRSAVLNNPEIWAAAPYLFVNRYSATNADVRIYKGHLQKADMIGNVGGRPVIYNDYIDKFQLMNAVGPNDPKLAARMLTPGQPYTALVVVNWGAFGKIYDIYSVSLYPTKDALRTVWTGGRGWDSVYVNDYVEVSGSDQPAYSRLDFTWTIYPNEIVRRALTGGAR